MLRYFLDKASAAHLTSDQVDINEKEPDVEDDEDEGRWDSVVEVLSMAEKEGSCMIDGYPPPFYGFFFVCPHNYPTMSILIVLSLRTLSSEFGSY